MAARGCRVQGAADGGTSCRGHPPGDSQHLLAIHQDQSFQQQQQDQGQGSKVAEPCGEEQGLALGEREDLCYRQVNQGARWLGLLELSPEPASALGPAHQIKWAQM